MNNENYKMVLLNLILYSKNNILNLNWNNKYINKKNFNIFINFYEKFLYFNNYDSKIYDKFIHFLKFHRSLLTLYYKKKYFAILNFPCLYNYKYHLIKINYDSYFSITNSHDANNTSRYIYKIFNTKNITITDATANIGGNAVSFCLNKFKFINVVEINKTCSEYLLNNLKCYNVNNYNIYNEDYINIYKDLKQDVIFLDPPWGGSNYKLEKEIDLYLSKINIIDIIYELFSINKIKLAVIKVPFNYNKKYMNDKLDEYHITIHKFRKYEVIYIN